MSEVRSSIDRGLRALLSRQLDDGSWDGRWTASVSATVQYARLKQQLEQLDEPYRRAIEWIVAQQNPSGGWGLRRGMADDPSLSHFCVGALAPALPAQHNVLVAGRRFLDEASPIEHEPWSRTYFVYWGDLESRGYRPTIPLPLAHLWANAPGRQTWLRAGINAHILTALVALRRSGRVRQWHPAIQRQTIEALLRDQEDAGEWSGTWSAMPPRTSIVVSCLHSLGWPADSPPVRAGVAALDRSLTPDGGLGQAIASNIWETALAALMLVRCGRPVRSAIERAGAFLARAQRPDGMLGWDSRLQGPCDFDDTAVALLASWLAGQRRGHQRGAGLITSHLRNGGLATFQRESPLFRNQWFRNAVDVTCHAADYLIATQGASAPALRPMLAWILRAQASDGSWRALWGLRKTYGTQCAVQTLAASGLPSDHAALRAAGAWLRASQQPDGGWGEDWDGNPAPSTVEQTGLALQALVTAGEPLDAPPVRRAIARLVGCQRADGSWPVSLIGCFPDQFADLWNTTNGATILALAALVAVENRAEKK